jgi:hypothetical protein
MPAVSKKLVMQVRCLHCGHKSILSDEALVDFGIRPEAPIAAFVKRLRCSDCGSGSVMANRVARNKPAVRRCAPNARPSLAAALNCRGRRRSYGRATKSAGSPPISRSCGDTPGSRRREISPGA